MSVSSQMEGKTVTIWKARKDEESLEGREAEEGQLRAQSRGRAERGGRNQRGPQEGPARPGGSEAGSHVPRHCGLGRVAPSVMS